MNSKISREPPRAGPERRNYFLKELYGTLCLHVLALAYATQQFNVKDKGESHHHYSLYNVSHSEVIVNVHIIERASMSASHHI